MKESVSTIMDGGLDKDLSAEELEQLVNDKSNRDTWNMYHLIGDAMRKDTVADFDIRREVAERLKVESFLPSVSQVEVTPKKYKILEYWQHWLGGAAVSACLVVTFIFGGGMLGYGGEESVPLGQQAVTYDLPDIDDPYFIAHEEAMSTVNTSHSSVVAQGGETAIEENGMVNSTMVANREM